MKSLLFFWDRNVFEPSCDNRYLSAKYELNGEEIELAIMRYNTKSLKDQLECNALDESHYIDHYQDVMDSIVLLWNGDILSDFDAKKTLKSLAEKILKLR